MKWFKTKQEKNQLLQTELVNLITKYAEEINSYCKIDNYIFILKGFKIENNKIVVKFIDKNTPEDYINYAGIYWFELRHGHSDFKKARYQFIHFKDELKKIGLKLEMI